jgi:hypothetical protein
MNIVNLFRTPEHLRLTPQNFEEKLVWYSIVGTFAIYFIGGLYVLGAILPWTLLSILCWRWWNQNPKTPLKERIHVPLGVWVWIGGMMMMQVSLIVGHLDYYLDMGQIIKSTIGWAKGWALLALFPLAGCLPIRPKLLYRAAAIVCAMVFLFSPIFISAYYLHLPEKLFVSPLQAIGGPGPEFFEFRLYEIDPGDNTPRWRLFTPWAPALGFVANIYFFMVLKEPCKKWKYLGIAGCIMMCQISKSRLALLCLPVVWILVEILSRASRPLSLIITGAIASTGGVTLPLVQEGLGKFSEQFAAARKDSSRVRSALGQIALYRWKTEAPVWGHGIVESGPHMVEFMPIGSHHTWYGLLFVKGVVGFTALAIPMIYSFGDLLFKSQRNDIAKSGLTMMLVIFLYTFGENLEILAYLYWPGLMLMGMGFCASPFEGEVSQELLIASSSETTGKKEGELTP